jgi:ribosomal protein S27E
MDYHQMTSPCGLDCFNCPMYLANEDLNLREKISEKRNLSFEKASCPGCRNAQGTIFSQGDTKPCAVFRCTSEKGITYCYECTEFPCDHLHPYADKASFRPHNTKLFNLCLIRKMGLEQWAKNKAANVKETYFNGKLRVHGTDKGEQ